MLQLLKNFAYWLTYKRIEEKDIDAIQIKLKEEDVLYFNLSSNQIISFNYDGQLYYFRESPVLRNFKDYFLASIDMFFKSIFCLGISETHFKQKILIRTSFRDDEIKRFKEYIDLNKTKKNFIKILSKADVISYNCGFSIWKEQKYDDEFFSKFSFYNLNDELKDIAIYFLWYMRSVACGYKKHNIVKGKNYSHFNAVRAISSRIVAEEIGLAHMITDARFCVLDFESGKKMFGVLSNSADGTRMSDTFVEINGSLQRELLNLNALDVISRQTDHGPNNYNVYEKEGAYSICAFDNDNPQTFFPYPFVKDTLAGCTPFVGKNNKVQRCYFDKQIAENIKNVDVKRLKMRLKPYLNFLQIGATVQRLKKLNKSINKTQNSNTKFLIESHEFSKTTACFEVNDKARYTYLSKVLDNIIKE